MTDRLHGWLRAGRRQGLIIAVIVVSAGLVIGNQFRLNADRRDAQAAQFCTAIPNAAAAGAQALVNILVANAEPGTPQAQIDETRRLGRLYVAEARHLALADLPDCPS